MQWDEEPVSRWVIEVYEPELRGDAWRPWAGYGPYADRTAALTALEHVRILWPERHFQLRLVAPPADYPASDMHAAP